MTPIQYVLHLGTWGQAHRWTLFYGMAGFFVLMFVLHLLQARRRAHAETHGSARWATRREIKKTGLLG